MQGTDITTHGIYVERGTSPGAPYPTVFHIIDADQRVTGQSQTGFKATTSTSGAFLAVTGRAQDIQQNQRLLQDLSLSDFTGPVSRQPMLPIGLMATRVYAADLGGSLVSFIGNRPGGALPEESRGEFVITSPTKRSAEGSRFEVSSNEDGTFHVSLESDAGTEDAYASMQWSKSDVRQAIAKLQQLIQD